MPDPQEVTALTAVQRDILTSIARETLAVLSEPPNAPLLESERVLMQRCRDVLRYEATCASLERENEALRYGPNMFCIATNDADALVEAWERAALVTVDGCTDFPASDAFLHIVDEIRSESPATPTAEQVATWKLGMLAAADALRSSGIRRDNKRLVQQSDAVEEAIAALPSLVERARERDTAVGHLASIMAGVDANEDKLRARLVEAERTNEVLDVTCAAHCEVLEDNERELSTLREDAERLREDRTALIDDFDLRHKAIKELESRSPTPEKNNDNG